MNSEEIEYMNAHGPYDHGIWAAAQNPQAPGITFGSSSLFATRAEVMSNKIIEYLKTVYSKSELQNLKILDVGCYDGWILTKISNHIKFARVVGVEPRQKNIDKGIFARKACQVSTDCEFLKGGYENLEELFPGETFDVVLCLGMLHHVNSVDHVIKAISAKCAKLLIVDSMVIPPLRADHAELAAVINPVDIIYRKKEKIWSIAAFKMESPYFDGSTSDAEIVNIPQESLIRMSLQTANFSKITPLMTERDFYPKEYQALRGVNEVMLAAFRDPDLASYKNRWKEDAFEYEKLFCLNPVSKPFLLYLFKNFSSENLSKFFLDVFGGTLPAENELQSTPVLNDEEKEIAGTISRAPYEKTLLELAKYQIDNAKVDSAKSLLCAITTATNADWRSFYRACFLLAKLERESGNLDRAQHYEKLLSISNPLFPLSTGQNP